MAIQATCEWLSSSQFRIFCENSYVVEENQGVVIAVPLSGSVYSPAFSASGANFYNIAGTDSFACFFMCAQKRYDRAAGEITGSSNIGELQECFVKFTTAQAAEQITYKTTQVWAQHGADAANDYLNSQTWDYVFPRQTAQPLATPTNLTSTNITINSAQVSWTGVENASSYKVEYRKQGDTTWNE